MVQNAYFLAKIGADTAEHEQHFADILPTFCQPTLSSVGARQEEASLQVAGRESELFGEELAAVALAATVRSEVNNLES